MDCKKFELPSEIVKIKIGNTAEDADYLDADYFTFKFKDEGIEITVTAPRNYGTPTHDFVARKMYEIDNSAYVAFTIQDSEICKEDAKIIAGQYVEDIIEFGEDDEGNFTMSHIQSICPEILEFTIWLEKSDWNFFDEDEEVVVPPKEYDKAELEKLSKETGFKKEDLVSIYQDEKRMGMLMNFKKGTSISYSEIRDRLRIKEG
jgi:hypothetical protein